MEPFVHGSRVDRIATCAFVFLVPAWLAGPASAQLPEPPQEVITGILPADLPAVQIVISTDTSRVYLISTAGEVWVRDRDARTSTRLVSGMSWDLSLASTGEAIAFTRAGEMPAGRAVWLLPLDSTTGLPSGAERMVAEDSDVPSISPDGRSIAFARDNPTGVGQSVVVAPMAGGAERVVLAALRAGVNHIRWTPDGESLSVGVNRQPHCSAGGGCFRLRPDATRTNGSILKVSVLGGGPTTLVTGRNLSPGMSPDGSLIVYPDSGRMARTMMVVSNADGERVQVFSTPQSYTAQGWLNGSTLFFLGPNIASVIRRYSVADGSRGRMFREGEGPGPSGFQLSPDGTLVSIVTWAPQNSWLRIYSIDGVLFNEVNFRRFANSRTAWSPDQRWIAVVTRGSGGTDLNLVEVSTGKATRLGQLRPNSRNQSMLWLSDSQTLLVSEDHALDSSEGGTTIREFEVDGEHRVVRELSHGSENSTGSRSYLVDNGHAIIHRITMDLQGEVAGNEILRVSFDSSSSEVSLALSESRYMPPLFSSSRRWVAIREWGAEGLELVRADGTERRDVTLPFKIAATPTNMLILENGEQLLVLGHGTEERPASVYRIEVSTGRSEKLFTIPGGTTLGALSFSPESGTALFYSREATAPSIVTVDLGAASRSVRQ